MHCMHIPPSPSECMDLSMTTSMFWDPLTYDLGSIGNRKGKKCPTPIRLK